MDQEMTAPPSDSPTHSKNGNEDHEVQEEEQEPFPFDELPLELKLKIVSLTVPELKSFKDPGPVVSGIRVSKWLSTCRVRTKSHVCGHMATSKDVTSSLCSVSHSMNELVKKFLFSKQHPFLMQGRVATCWNALMKISAADLKNIRRLHIDVAGLQVGGAHEDLVDFVTHLHGITTPSRLQLSIYAPWESFEENWGCPCCDSDDELGIPARPLRNFRDFVLTKAKFPKFRRLEVLFPKHLLGLPGTGKQKGYWDAVLIYPSTETEIKKQGLEVITMRTVMN